MDCYSVGTEVAEPSQVRNTLVPLAVGLTNGRVRSRIAICRVTSLPATASGRRLPNLAKSGTLWLPLTLGSTVIHGPAEEAGISNTGFDEESPLGLQRSFESRSDGLPDLVMRSGTGMMKCGAY